MSEKLFSLPLTTKMLNYLLMLNLLSKDDYKELTTPKLFNNTYAQFIMNREKIG